MLSFPLNIDLKLISVNHKFEKINEFNNFMATEINESLLSCVKHLGSRKTELRSERSFLRVRIELINTLTLFSLSKLKVKKTKF